MMSFKFFIKKIDQQHVILQPTQALQQQLQYHQQSLCKGCQVIGHCQNALHLAFQSQKDLQTEHSIFLPVHALPQHSRPQHTLRLGQQIHFNLSYFIRLSTKVLLAPICLSVFFTILINSIQGALL